MVQRQLIPFGMFPGGFEPLTTADLPHAVLAEGRALVLEPGCDPAKVSSDGEGEYQTSQVLIICTEPNPEGSGIVEEVVDDSFVGTYPARAQPFTPGSCAQCR
ncbi:uncharacterized protein METZ01_LOCUS337291 [marine metagenome]|jgi:hypothetical protein|uniref:Uncharacterized protein n=1 Tax=marine metagenome TaxID=408172 RepID=A0A382QHH0_9ZZZZ